MATYAQRYLNAWLAEIARTEPGHAPKVLGQIAPTQGRQPHIAAYVQLSEGSCVGSTIGLSERPTPLPVKNGFQYFELCARTRVPSPGVLWLLSNIGLHMLATSSPFFFGEPGAPLTEPVPFLAYQSLAFGGDGFRLLFVPRWKFFVPHGPPIEVIEPLPITEEQWALLGPMTLEQRGAWAASLGERSRDQWTPLLAMG